MLTQKFLKNESLKCINKFALIKNNINYFKNPFQHLIIDNFFSSKLANLCLKNFPLKNSSSWIASNDEGIEIKKRSNWKSEFDIPEGIVGAVRILNSSIFLKEIAKIFKIHKIIPDPYFTGGGLNLTAKNGLLDVHIDGNFHDATDLHRRLNALIFLNKNWQKSWKGELGLYDKKGKECLKKIEPVFNRLVVFETHDYSFHGLPDPLNFPNTNSRKSIILYYYTKANKSKKHTSVSKPHSALWVKKGLLDKKGRKVRKIFKI